MHKLDNKTPISQKMMTSTSNLTILRPELEVLLRGTLRFPESVG